MTGRRRWLLVPLLLLCTALLAACDLPWPLNKIGGSTEPTAQQEVYVASLITRNIVEQQGVVLAVEPQASTFLEGEVVLFVLNKWSGLAVGDHTETALVLTAAGAEIGREATEFTITEADLTGTLMEPFVFEDLAPGRYWIVIELDGVEMVRYQFQVVPSEG